MPWHRQQPSAESCLMAVLTIQVTLLNVQSRMSILLTLRVTKSHSNNIEIRILSTCQKIWSWFTWPGTCQNFVRPLIFVRKYVGNRLTPSSCFAKIYLRIRPNHQKVILPGLLAFTYLLIYLICLWLSQTNTVCCTYLTKIYSIFSEVKPNNLSVIT